MPAWPAKGWPARPWRTSPVRPRCLAPRCTAISPEAGNNSSATPWPGRRRGSSAGWRRPRRAAATAGAADLEDLLVAALLFARRAVAEHEVLQKMLQTEPETLLAGLSL